jgi:sn-glycerol 3-phosphate transport system ATP-binding protein
MATLELSGLRKSFGATAVLHGIDLTLVDGEMLVIVGASGCGKSTLLRLVAGLERASAGRILLDGRDITDVDPSSRDIAMVFQNYALYPHMSVFDNMAYGLRIRGLSRMEIAEKVDEAAAMLGLGELLARKPRQLSGGQRQRVAMGRAIVRAPKLFLFDEPLSNLDAKLRVQMRAEIRHLQRRLGVTSLYVTHDQVEAMTLGDRLLVLHQGRPAQLATPMEVFDRPADTYVAGFIGAPAMNFLPAVLTRGGTAVRLEAGPEITFLDGSRPGLNGKRLTIGIRPEHLILDDDGLALVVDLIEPLGSETLVHARLAAPVSRGAERGAGGPIVIKLSGHAPVEWVEEKRIGVRLDPSQMHVFDAATGRRLEPGNCRDSALPA